MGTRIAVFNKGCIEQLGAPMDLYERPANEFVAGFLGAPRINLVARPGAGASEPHQALWAALAGPADPAARRMGLRAEHLRLLPAGQGSVAATVALAEHLGDSSVVYLRLAGLPELLHAKLGAGHGHLASGDTVGLQPDPAWALAFDAQGRRIP